LICSRTADLEPAKVDVCIVHQREVCRLGQSRRWSHSEKRSGGGRKNMSHGRRYNTFAGKPATPVTA
jgi:hypothetical protein